MVPSPKESQQINLMVTLRLIALFIGLAVLIRLVTRIRFLLLAAPGGVGLAAKQLCSLVYVCGFEAETARSIYIEKTISPLKMPLTVKYDPKRRRVTATGFGVWSATAEMRDGVGSTIITGKDHASPPPVVDLPFVDEKPLSRATPEEITTTFNQSLVENALQQAFTPGFDTLAVAVLHRGKLITDRYAAGIHSSTPLPGWSMAKSVTATLVGLLVKQNRLDINTPGVVPEWLDHTDGGATVTLDHLLRMISGLDVTEDQSGTDPNTRMLFVESDAAAFAAKRGLKTIPGAHWEYMSGSTVLASRAVIQATGGTLETSQAFMREALFDPLGAASFKMETDAAGTFIGSSFAIASTHDWAKFGQLYLDDGVWKGERLLPDWWRSYVTRHTLQSGVNSYGAGFWTIEHSDLNNLPQDIFYANGFQGQYVIVIPSRSLVIVRLGASHGPTGIWQLVEDLITAMEGYDQ